VLRIATKGRTCIEMSGAARGRYGAKWMGWDEMEGNEISDSSADEVRGASSEEQVGSRAGEGVD
jgi:hypothetical protein